MTYSVTAGGTRLFCEDWGDGRRLVAVQVRGAGRVWARNASMRAGRCWMAGGWLMTGPRR